MQFLYYGYFYTSHALFKVYLHMLMFFLFKQIDW